MPDLGGMPIIRLEVERMRHTIVAAFAEYAIRMDADIQAAVEEICTPEHVTAIVQAAAKQAIEAQIKLEVDAFFRYGEGRAAIKSAVNAQLSHRENEDAA